MLDWKKKLKQGTLLFLQHWIFQKSLIHHFVWFLRAEPFIDSFKYSHATVPKTIPIVSKPAQSCEKPGEPFKIYYESFPTPRGHGARCFVRNMLPWRNRAGEVGGEGVGWNVLSWRNAGVSSRPIPHSGLAVSPVLCNREWGFQICLPPRVPIPFPLTKWYHKPSTCYNTLITLLQGYGCCGRRVEPVECISGWYVRRTTSTHKWSRTM